MIVRTEAVVLRSMDYGETSQIVTLYTRRFGTVSVMAKGARRPKSKFGSSLQPMAYTQVVYYHRPNRTLQTLSESAHVEPLHGIARSLDRLTVGLRIVELTRALLPEEAPNPAVFNLLLDVLRTLSEAEERVENLLLFFALRLASELGFDPAFEREEVGALPEEGGVLVLDDGRIVPLGRATAGLQASRGALRAFAICARADLDTVMRMQLSPGRYEETRQLVEAYLRHHVEEAYPTRTGKVAEQMASFRTDRGR